MSRARRSAVWLAGAATIVVAAPLAAQGFQVPPSFGSGNPTAYREDPASALARYLRIITASPRNLEALTGAGRAALEVGDPQAAIGFYARAEAIAPRNGRVKAGLGSALVLLNQEQAALGYFDDATDLGVPEADIASDRGLAHDLRGSAKRAQRDYALVLKRGEDAETTRRMALSLAITGERAAALTLLDPLLRRQDTAAWRARAFILAMTGDTAGASRAAESVMPAATAAGFAPFFRKLPTLRPGEKAAAVHFGLFPGEQRPMRIDDLFNQAEVAARVALESTPRSATDAGSVDGAQVALGRMASRSPNEEGQLSARLAQRPAATTPVAVTPRSNAANVPAARPAPSVIAAAPRGAVSSLPSEARTPSIDGTGFLPGSTPAVAPVPTPAPVPAPMTIEVAATDTPQALSATPPATPPVTPSSSPTGRPPATAPLPGFSTGINPAFPSPQAAPLPVATAPATSVVTAMPAAATPRLAEISTTVGEAVREPLVRPVDLPASTVPVLPSAAASVVSVPTPQPLTGTRLAEVARVLNEAPTRVETVPAPQAAATTLPPPAPKPKVESSPNVRALETTAAAVPPAPKPKVENGARETPTENNPRIWVQVAGGADEKAFPNEWKRLRGKAPELLSAQTAWMTPLKATNRLLVGPFDSDEDAQEFVNKLKPKGITAFAWTSAKGQAIAKLGAR